MRIPLSESEKAFLPTRQTRAATPAERLRDLPADADERELARALSGTGARILSGPIPGACPKCQSPMERPEDFPNGFAMAGCLWCRYLVVGRAAGGTE